MAPAVFSNIQRRSPRWIIATLLLTAVAWLFLLAGLLALANRVHDDVPYALAVKLPLLQLQPELIFAGDSRTEYQVDAGLAAQMMGKPAGSAINIAYLAGEPLAVLAAIHRKPNRFEKADLVISVAPLALNEGVRQASLNPRDATARLGVYRQMTTFLPLRIGTLIRFIREAFLSRLAIDQHLDDLAPAPPDFGLIRLQAGDSSRWLDKISKDPTYAGWSLSNPRTQYEMGALCQMAKRVRKLTVVFPPWAPRYDRNTDPPWRDMDHEMVSMVESAGSRCGFEVLDLPSVPGLADENFFDESHLSASGIPIYTRHLMTQLRR